MRGMNKIFLLGNLGKDPKTSATQQGTTVCDFTLATSETYTDRDGQKREETQWHSVRVYGKQAEACGQYLRKGSLALVEGSVKYSKSTGRDGIERYYTNVNADRVQFLDRKDDATAYRAREPVTAAQRDTGDDATFDDDIPF